VLLPVQASPARISIIYYVMSRDVRVPLDEQAIQVSIQGGGIQNSTITCYDPVSDTYPALNNPALDLNQVVLELPATDSPRVLVFE
jgi:hypothetical protein